MNDEEGKLSSSGWATTSSSSLTSAVDLADVMSMAKTNTANEERTDDGNLKEEGCSSTDTDCYNSQAKEMVQNDDYSTQSQPHEPTFPQQLMDLIEKETTDSNAATIHGQKAIEWLSTGDKFIIHDKVTLESCVLSKYFNNKCKFMSFVRKLYR